MKKILLVLFSILSFINVRAQHQELHEKAETYKGNKKTDIDTSSLLAAFKEGNFNGHFRYFFMATDNKNLSDYYANAAGGGIRYETAKFHGFQMAVSGFYIFNVGSSDFTKLDTHTKQANRYEIAHFDVEDPNNKKDLDRLEELYLKYSKKNIALTYGRQLINTPFVNLQDGRMRPTGVEGLWSEYKNKHSNTKIEAGILYSISPRGTVNWYNIGESIGILSNGVNIDGTKANYKDNVESKSISMLGIYQKINKYLNFQLWEMYTDNVFNTAMFQLNFEKPLDNHSQVFSAIQFTKQHFVNNGGNENTSETYFNKNESSLVISSRIGIKNKQWEHSFNHTRITKDGRYLMPREWGREHFFTFMPRERNEGLGDVNAFVAKSSYTHKNKKLKLTTGLGYFKLPDVKNTSLNKYGMPTYTQFNTDVKYAFSNRLNGFDIHFLLASKLNRGNVYNDSKYQLNKVDMINYNLVVNFHF